MRSSNDFRRFAVPAVLAAALLGACLVAGAQQDAPASDEGLAALRAQVDELSRYAVRSQAHVMIDVEYHFANLWFAAREARWDLAAFYLREARSHIGWAVSIRPVRPLKGGGTVALAPLRQAIEAQGLAPLAQTLERRDVPAFEFAYRHTLQHCNNCHEAAEKPYLEVRVPAAAPSPMLFGGE